MAGELVRYEQFDFKGDRVPLLVDDTGRFVLFPRVCLALGLDIGREWAAIHKRDALAAHARIEFDPDTGDPRYYFRAEAVPGWLLTMESAAFPKAIRAKHTAYCNELIPAVYAYTTKGVAIKEGTPLIAVLKEACEYALRLNPTAQTRLIASAAIESELLRIAGKGGAGRPPVTVAYRCQMLGHSPAKSEVIAIGQLVAKAYRAATGKDPTKHPQMIDGRMTPVCDYTEADQPLIDRVIADYYRGRKPR